MASKNCFIRSPWRIAALWLLCVFSHNVSQIGWRLLQSAFPSCSMWLFQCQDVHLYSVSDSTRISRECMKINYINYFLVIGIDKLRLYAQLNRLKLNIIEEQEHFHEKPVTVFVWMQPSKSDTRIQRRLRTAGARRQSIILLLSTPSLRFFLAYFPYFEKIKQAYEITLLSVCMCVCVSVYPPN
jgi:hypothetical protein